MNRRSILGFAPAALFAVAAPAVAQPADPWDALMAALTTINPALEDKARQARAAGYEPHELHIISNGSEPILVFRREYGDPGSRLASFPTFAANRTEGF